MAIFRKLFAGDIKTGCYVSIGALWRKNIELFFHFRTLREKFSNIYQWISVRVVNTAFSVSLGTVSGHIFLKDFCFLCLFRSREINFRRFVQNGPTSLSELRPKIHRNNSQKTYFPEKLVFLIIFRLDWYFFETLLNFSGGVNKTAYYKSIKTFEGNFFSWKNILNFEIGVQTCQNFAGYSSKVAETAIHVSVWIFWWKIFWIFFSLSDIVGNCFVRFSINFLRCCQNCFLQIQGIILLKEILTRKKCLLIIFQAGKTHFQNFVEVFLAVWSKLQATCSGESFEETHLFCINCVFRNLFQTLTRTYLAIFQKLYGGEVKTGCFVSIRIIL